MGIRELREHAREHHGVFDGQEAKTFDVTPSQLRRGVESGRFVRLEHNVYGIGGAPDSWLRRARVATLTTRGFLSHHSALALYGVDGFDPGSIQVTVPKTRMIERDDFTIHRSTQVDLADIRDVQGIRVSSIGRALLDYGGTAWDRRLGWAVDAALRHEMCDLAALYDVWVRHSIQGRNGCGPMRRLLDERHMSDPIPDSRFNRLVGQLLADAGLAEPLYEYEVRTDAGLFIARVDLAYPQHRIAIELDSVRWHLNKQSFVRDPRRKNALTLAGWTVFTFTWADYVDQPDAIVRTIRQARSTRAA